MYAVRLGPAAVARIDQLAAARATTRSAVIRELLRLGLDAYSRDRR
jgi:predicted transcriptional regulator